jgi:pimeloyl-ACP methyl ester carboxylesterase
MAFPHPERLTALVVVDGAAGPIDDREIDEWEQRRAARPPAPADVEGYVDYTMKQIFANPSRVPASFRDDLRFQFEHAATGQVDAVAEDRRTVMPYGSLRMPTLVVWGEEDSMTPPARGRRLAEAIPGARFVGLPGVGHTCQVEAPAEFVAAVAPFLDALAGSPSPAVRGSQR